MIDSDTKNIWVVYMYRWKLSCCCGLLAATSRVVAQVTNAFLVHTYWQSVLGAELTYLVAAYQPPASIVLTSDELGTCSDHTSDTSDTTVSQPQARSFTVSIASWVPSIAEYMPALVKLRT